MKEILETLLALDLRLYISKENGHARVAVSAGNNWTHSQMLPIDHLDKDLVKCIEFCKDKLLAKMSAKRNAAVVKVTNESGKDEYRIVSIALAEKWRLNVVFAGPHKVCQIMYLAFAGRLKR